MMLNKQGKFGKETILIRDVIDGKISEQTKKLLKNSNMTNVLKRASTNRVLYYFSKKIAKHFNNNQKITKNLNLIISEGDEYIRKFNKTIQFIVKNFKSERIPVLISKTHRVIPYVTMDVDAFVGSKYYKKAKEKLEKFQKEGNFQEVYKHKKMNTELNFIRARLPKILVINFRRKKLENNYAKHIEIPGLLISDLHKEFFWQYYNYFNPNIYWKDRRMIKSSDIEFNIPSIEVEVILSLVHILRERRAINYLEFLFIKDLSKKADWNIVFEESKKYGWRILFIKLVALLNQLNKMLYPEEKDPLINFKASSKFKIKGDVEMPFILPLKFGLQTFYIRFKRVLNLPLYEIFYFVFIYLKYHVSNKIEVPVYSHWFNFKQMKF